MPPEKELLIKFYFLVVISIAITPALYSLLLPSSLGLDVASAQIESGRVGSGNVGSGKVGPRSGGVGKTGFGNGGVEEGTPIAYSVDGWVWALSTDSASAPSLTIDSNGTLQFISGGNPSGPGWIALTHTTGTPRFVSPGVTQSSPYDYGLTLYITDSSTRQGYFEGDIWSSSFGWIEFSNSATGCPSGLCSATVDTAGHVHGWARILSLPDAGSNAGGFSGWLKLGWESGDLGIDWSADGLRVESDGTFTGYAWSNEFGWFKFIGRAGNPPPVVVNHASCNLDANPRTVKIPRATPLDPNPSARTTVAWGCSMVKDSPPCTFTEATPSSTISANAASSSPFWGIVKTLSRTTTYTISCTSAVDNSLVSGHDVVTAQNPTQIIECNPNSTNSTNCN